MKKTAGELVILTVIFLMLMAIMACGAFFLSAPGQKMLWDLANIFPVFLWIAAAGLFIILIGAPLFFVIREIRFRGVIYADERGLYPIVKQKGEYVKLASKEAEIAAAVAGSQTQYGLKLTKGAAQGIVQPFVDAQWRDAPAPEQPPLLEAPLPRMVNIYDDAPTLQQPALPIGVTDAGHLELPLHNLGNGLVGGLPGGGKSELLASMMVALMRYSPEGRAVQIAVIDTKRIDFGNIPGDIAPMWQPVARDIEDGKELIQMLVAEADRRFQILEQHRARSLRSYNAMPEVTPLPYLVMFVDEIADWAGDKEFEHMAVTIGRKGRAAGITFVAATQRTGAKEISSSLRAVMGFGVAFRTRSNIDSRLIIGDRGAETIARQDKGRCLVWTGEELKVVQAYYAGIDEGRFDHFTLSLPKKSSVRGASPRASERASDRASAASPRASDASYPASGSASGGAKSASSALQARKTPQNWVRSANPLRSASFASSRHFDAVDYIRTMERRSERDGQSATISRKAAQLVYSQYKEAGSLRALQRTLWPDIPSSGGHRFYWLRDIVEQMERKPRTRPTVTVIFPEKKKRQQS
ncbi:MAG: hypothetical protein DSY55_04345 [Clostridia bacterium]|nr:MAG: hypothetical protein DSY55_04345 [Clostridia bacterium]